MTTIPTTITVRVIAKGGKFLGDDIGGAQVTIRDAQTGELLASGTTQGGSGNTAEIMQTCRERGEPIPTDMASAFTITIPLDQPRPIEATAYGPLGGLQSANKVSATQWIVPGNDLTGGDGLLLEIPGLLVQVLSPPTHLALTGPTTIQFAANVAMMCGCPLEPGGIWDSNTFQVCARISVESQEIAQVPLTYAGQPSQFSGTWALSEPGFYEAVIYAYQPANGNTGMGRVTFFLPG
jgi:hypothetical protein